MKKNLLKWILWLSIINAILLPLNSVYAETIVHNDRSGREHFESTPKRNISPSISDGNFNSEDNSIRQQTTSSKANIQDSLVQPKSMPAANNTSLEENPKISTLVSDNYTRIDSTYVIAKGTKKEGVDFSCQVIKSRIFGIISAYESSEFFVSYYIRDDSIKNPIVMSKKHPITLTIDINGKSKNIVVKNINSSTNYTYATVEINNNIFDAKDNPVKIYLKFFTQDGTTKIIDIPYNVIQQWQQVLHTDIKQLRRDITER